MRRLIILLALAALLVPAMARARCEGRNIQYGPDGWATQGEVFRDGKKVATILRGRSWYVWHVQCENSPLAEIHPSAQKAYWEACWRCP